MSLRSALALICYLSLTFVIASQAPDPFIILGIMIASAIFLIGFYHMTKPYIDVYEEVKQKYDS